MVAPPNGLFRLAKIFGNFVNVARPRDNATGRIGEAGDLWFGLMVLGFSKFPFCLQPKIQVPAGRTTVDLP